MGLISVALGLYSVYKEFQRDLESTLRRVKAIGYDGVEFYGPFSYEPEKIKALLEEIGLVNCGWHTEWKLLQADTIEATLDYHARAGTTRIIIPALGGPWEIGHKQSEDCAEVWVQYAARINELAKLTEERNFRIGYHTHAHEFDTHFGELTPWSILSEHTDSGVILELDTGNCIEAEADPAQVIGDHPGRVELVHCKPFSHKLGHETFIGSAADDNDWPSILEACIRSGTEWLIVEHESETEYPQFDGTERCYAGMMEQLSRLQAAEDRGI
ncbi:sugar phosphate isomerase/epimerase family protein [Paenibacillus sp. NPDC058174]|uniref:sugar phosphate isomerase/epimerase family protein n=1 Tax=Paenibacillus sp. NPDC058174 TaxID=3346366 RepID=UPI0036D79412